MNEFETAVVNEPSVFERLKFYYIQTYGADYAQRSVNDMESCTDHTLQIALARVSKQ